LDFRTENNPEKLIINIDHIPFEIVHNLIKIKNKQEIIVPDDFKIEQKDNYLEIYCKNNKKRNNNENLQAEKKQKIDNKESISDNIIDVSMKQIAEIELSPTYLQGYFLGLKHANNPKEKFNFLDKVFLEKAFDKISDPVAQHIIQTELALMFYYDVKNLDRFQKAFSLLKDVAFKTFDPASQQKAQALLAEMYLNGLGPVADDPDRFKKAFDLFKIAVDKEDDQAAQHIAQVYLAEMYYDNVHFDLNCDDGYEKASSL
jgi:TPR repeat protein